MSVDYRVEVHRKEDGKKVAEFICNHVKGLFSTEVVRCNDFRKFEYDSLQKIESDIKCEINELNGKIRDMKEMIPKCQNVNVKHEIEDDLHYSEERISDLTGALKDCHIIEGYVLLAVEDMILPREDGKEDENEDDDINVAYMYNANGLGENRTIWVDDVYCTVNAE